jgi:hypothetical protein
MRRFALLSKTFPRQKMPLARWGVIVALER